MGSTLASIADGVGVPKDLSRAVALWKKGCEGNAARACLELGVVYATGKGAPRSVAEASSLYRKACSGGDTRGCVNLGAIYAAGGEGGWAG